MQPSLVAVAHGTRNPAGPQTVEALMAQVRRRLPGVAVETSYVELNEPSFAETMAQATGPTVVVPLLLSRGYHVSHDLPTMARASRFPVRVTRALGPHPLIAALMCQRLQAAGARRGDAVVMIAAGTNDADGVVDTLAAGRMLQAHWGAPVRVAHLSGRGHSVTEVVAGLYAEGHRRIAAASYLLAPGYFARKAQAQAMVAGCLGVSEVLGGHRMMVELVVRRYLALAGVRRLPQAEASERVA